MNIESAFITDIGQKRSQNQDSGCARNDLGLFLVADGMGGHQGGETASRMVVEIVPEELEEYLKTKKSAKSSKEILKQSIREANQKIHELSVREPSLTGMGTTTIALLLTNHQAIIANVGDSRCYLIQKEGLWQLSRDHSIVAEKVRAGLISREQAKKDMMKNVITRSVGFDTQVDVDVFEYTPQTGDLFLLCSDGLSGLVSDEEIASVLQNTKNTDLDTLAKTLIDKANSNGGDDNITVVLARVGKIESE